MKSSQFDKRTVLLSLLLSLLLMFCVTACDTAITEDPEGLEDTALESLSTEKTTDTPTEGRETNVESLTTTDAQTDEETETEAVVSVPTEPFEDFVCFADYSSTSTTTKALIGDSTYATSFTVPEGYMTSLALNLTNFSKLTETELVIRLYAFDGDFGSSVAKRALRTEYVDSIMRTYTMWFGKNKMPAGDYLAVVSTVTEKAEGESIKVGTLWLPNTLPDEYEQYHLVSYIDGKPSKKGNSLYGGFTYVHNVPINESLEQPIAEKDGDDCAKVILLAGQSNAVGSSGVGYLAKNVSEEKYDEYRNGYENVKILYRNTSTSKTDLELNSKSDDFVSVKVGQGYGVSSFGPELGLAEYLSKTYPDETFYIIKYGIGGSSAAGYWNANDTERRRGLDAFKDTVDDGLALLEEDGLTPKIVAMLWMQGESDGGSFPGAYNYYKLQAALAEEIRTDYADYASVRGIAFIDGAASDSGYWNCYMTVNYCKRLFERDSHLNYFVDTNVNGLTTLYENSDPAHYDSTSMIWLGQLFGECVSKAID